MWRVVRGMSWIQIPPARISFQSLGRRRLRTHQAERCSRRRSELELGADLRDDDGRQGGGQLLLERREHRLHRVFACGSRASGTNTFVKTASMSRCSVGCDIVCTDAMSCSCSVAADPGGIEDEEGPRDFMPTRMAGDRIGCLAKLIYVADDLPE